MFRNIAIVLLIIVMSTLTIVRVSPLVLSHEQQQAFERGIVEVIRRTTGYSPKYGRFARAEPNMEQELTRRGTRATGPAVADTQVRNRTPVQSSHISRPQFTQGYAIAPTTGAKRIRVGE